MEVAKLFSEDAGLAVRADQYGQPGAIAFITMRFAVGQIIP